jgi:hypothetical protein
MGQSCDSVPSCLGPISDLPRANTARALDSSMEPFLQWVHLAMSFGMYLAGILLVISGGAYGDTLIVPRAPARSLLGHTREVGCRSRDRQQSARERDTADR